MSATNHTANYNLPQFIGTDVPSWLTDINGAFSAIDTAIDAAKDTADGAAGDVTALGSRVTTAEGDIGGGRCDGAQHQRSRQARERSNATRSPAGMR